MDPQRVYPMDSNARKPPYVMLSPNGGEAPTTTIQPPPYRRSVPRYPSKHKRRACACSCLCCLCCCSCSILLLCTSILGFLYALYMVYDPQVPNYQIDGLDVAAFNLRPDFSLHAEFVVAVKAENTNRRVSIIYGEESQVTVIYKDAELCSGKLPAIRQGHRNTTVMEVRLKGDSPFGSGLQEALMDNRESKRIPLDVFVKVPVTIAIDSLKMEVGPARVLMDCNLIVDNLSPNEKINILHSEYNVHFDMF